MSVDRFDIRLLNYTMTFGKILGVYPISFSKRHKFRSIFYKLYLLIIWCCIFWLSTLALMRRGESIYKNNVLTNNTVDFITFVVEFIFILVCRIAPFTQHKTFGQLCQSLTTLERRLDFTNFKVKKRDVYNIISRICILHGVFFGLHIRELIFKLEKKDYDFLILSLNHIVTMYHQFVIFQFVTMINYILLAR